jgi:hypothetical protein
LTPSSPERYAFRGVVAAMVLFWPAVAAASFNGRIDLPFGVIVAAGVFGALPGAVAVLLLEWAGATRTPPSWAGALAAVVLVYCVLRVTGLVRGAEPGWFLFPIPPLIELVLITFITSPHTRHAAGWVVAVAILLILWLTPAVGQPANLQFAKDAWAVIIGGAPTTALLWQVGVRLGRRSLRRRAT